MRAGMWTAGSGNVCQGTLQQCLGPNPFFAWVDDNLVLAITLAFVFSLLLILSIALVPMLRLRARSGSAALKQTGLRGTARILGVKIRNIRQGTSMGVSAIQMVTIRAEVCLPDRRTFEGETSLWVPVMDSPTVERGGTYAAYVDPLKLQKFYIDLSQPATLF